MCGFAPQTDTNVLFTRFLVKNRGECYSNRHATECCGTLFWIACLLILIHRHCKRRLCSVEFCRNTRQWHALHMLPPILSDDCNTSIHKTIYIYIYVPILSKVKLVLHYVFLSMCKYHQQTLVTCL